MDGERTRRSCVTILAAIGIASLAWAGGGDPWNSKPYQQWNDTDITKVLHQSPWARNLTVEQTWKVLGAADLKPDDATAGARIGPSMGGAGHSGTIMPAEHDDDATTRGPEVHFDVYWASSRTIREALAQRAVLHNGSDAKQASDYVSAVQDHYQVLIQGADLAPFRRKSEKEYVDLAWLQLKGSKDKIAPSQVIFMRDDKNAVNAVCFYFPKKATSGSPTIPDGTKAADFYCKVGASTIHASFEIQKMQDQKGVDL
jgi:hypothetical protein